MIATYLTRVINISWQMISLSAPLTVYCRPNGKAVLFKLRQITPSAQDVCYGLSSYNAISRYKDKRWKIHRMACHGWQIITRTHRDVAPARRRIANQGRISDLGERTTKFGQGAKPGRHLHLNKKDHLHMNLLCSLASIPICCFIYKFQTQLTVNQRILTGYLCNFSSGEFMYQ